MDLCKQILIFLLPLWELKSFRCECAISIGEGFTVVKNWPKYSDFGQISGIGVDGLNNVYVFHRGNRQWDYNTFTKTNVFAHRDRGAIPNETIVVLNSSTGSLLSKAGSNLFYLPHGLTIDHENNIWVTDVALHQVFKFPPLLIQNQNSKLGKSLLSLGVAFEPGNDENHFCKPTDVAVDSLTSDFFVSDGYCNSRIIKYDRFGKKLIEWGRTSLGNVNDNFFMLNIPHALAMRQDNPGALYVADRENFRVIAYSPENGNFLGIFTNEFNGRVFSIAYSKVKFSNTEVNLIFILIQHERGNELSVYNTEDGKFLSNLYLKNYFSNPHDLSLSASGKYCYIVELNPFKIWKFEIDFTKILSNGSNDTVIQANISYDDNFRTLYLHKSDMLDSFYELVGTSNYLAIALVVAVLLITFVFFMLHYRKRRGYRLYESKRLIIDEDEDDSNLSGAIKLN